jgi:hypothetical protein
VLGVDAAAAIGREENALAAFTVRELEFVAVTREQGLAVSVTMMAKRPRQQSPQPVQS